MSEWPETQLNLIRRLSDRDDRDAWSYFEEYYQQPIYRFARSRGLQPDEALDVVQEVLLAVHKTAFHWKASNRRGSFRAWLAEAARRLTLQVTRSRGRIGRGLGGSGFHALMEASEQPTPADSVDEDHRWAFYCAAAKVQKEVNPQHWLAFWGTAVDGKSAEEVGNQLNMKSGSVYSAKCRVLARLKQCIEEQSTDRLVSGGES
jgi:RNA polymerase sigma factor (sigma-70 family)